MSCLKYRLVGTPRIVVSEPVTALDTPGHEMPLVRQALVIAGIGSGLLVTAHSLLLRLFARRW